MVRNNEARSTDIRVFGQKEETIRERVDVAVGNLRAATFSRQIRPDLIEFGYGLPSKSVSH